MEWLCNAHAAEQQAKTMPCLTGWQTRTEHYPDLKNRLKQHAK
jgi:hypothetical protein